MRIGLRYIVPMFEKESGSASHPRPRLNTKHRRPLIIGKSNKTQSDSECPDCSWLPFGQLSRALVTRIPSLHNSITPPLPLHQIAVICTDSHRFAVILKAHGPIDRIRRLSSSPFFDILKLAIPPARPHSGVPGRRQGTPGPRGTAER